MKRFLPVALLLIGNALEAQTWSELSPVSTDYTAYTTARVKVDPITLTPYVAFKARKEVASGNDHYYAHIYRLVEGQWQHVAASTDQVYSNYLDFGFSKTGRSYIAYADADSTVKGTTLEQVIPAANACKLLAANMEKAQATYLGLGVVSDDKMVSVCTGNTNGTYKNVTAASVYDATTKSWQASLGPSGNMEIYKSTVCSSASGEVYVAAMERSKPYAIHVYQYGAEGWSELGSYPQEETNAIYVGTFKLSTDAAGHLYSLTCDNATGEDLVRIRQYDAETQSWSTLGGAPTPIHATSRYQLAAHAVRPDGVHVIAYQDLSDSSLPKVIEFDSVAQTWSEPLLLSEVAANNSGSMSLEFAGNGMGYVSYLDGNNQVRVCQYTPASLSMEPFGTLYDVLNYRTFDVSASVGSGQTFSFAAPTTGNSYEYGGYAYNNILRDSLGTEYLRDTTQIGLNLRMRLSNGVQTGFVTTSVAEGIVADRVRIAFIYYNSASMAGRTLLVTGKETPFAGTGDLTNEETRGTQLAEIEYAPNGVIDIDVTALGNYRYLGFYTKSTGFGIREITIGWREGEDAAIQQVADDLYVTGEKRLYNLQGQPLTGDVQTQGIYILRQGKHSVKAIVR